MFAKDGNPEKSGCPQLGAWWATVHGGGKELDATEATEHACTHCQFKRLSSVIVQ